MASPDDKVLAGVITGAHGIKGEVKLKSFTADPKAIAAYGALLASTGERFEIQRLKAQKDGFIATLKGVGDRNRAETLKGVELFVQRRQLPAPEADEVYIHDLIGVTVMDMGGEKFGTVVAVPNFGAGDLIEIRRDGAEETVLVPFAQDYVPEIDLAKGRIVIDLPATWLDEDERQRG
ncbi:ribosome maturation factor RimM [Taklimakanibacter deserti]|uniref:ribosome maturation factor RimM n=1 Tax=Taklimakanibacter deserti TaxID=2267839 RepID=UPI000E655538